MKKLKIGIPDHNIERSILKLVRNNYTVVVAVQTESEFEYKNRMEEIKI
jgi:DNA mismatch repair ATPase MutS